MIFYVSNLAHVLFSAGLIGLRFINVGGWVKVYLVERYSSGDATDAYRSARRENVFRSDVYCILSFASPLIGCVLHITICKSI